MTKFVALVLMALLSSPIVLGIGGPDADAAQLCWWEGGSDSVECVQIYGDCKDFGIPEGVVESDSAGFTSCKTEWLTAPGGPRGPVGPEYD